MNGFKLSISFLVLISSVDAACKIVYYRSEPDNHFLLRQDVRADECSYSSVIQSLRNQGLAPGEIHSVFKLDNNSVLVYDLDDDVKSVWDDDYELTWEPISAERLPETGALELLEPEGKPEPVAWNAKPMASLPEPPVMYPESLDYDPWASMKMDDLTLPEFTWNDVSDWYPTAAADGPTFDDDLPTPGASGPISRASELYDATPTASAIGKIGLPNLGGVTCYANSLLQCLYHIPQFRERLGEAVTSLKLKDETLAGSMNAIFKDIEASVKPSEDKMFAFVSSICDKLNRTVSVCNDEGHWVQSDSAEVLTAIFEYLNVELLPEPKPLQVQLGQGWLDDIFGLINAETRVTHEGTTSKMVRSEYMLTLKASPEALNQFMMMFDDIANASELQAMASVGVPLEREQLQFISQVEDSMVRMKLGAMISELLRPDETVGEEGKVYETITKSFTKLPSCLFINFSRSGFGYRLSNAIDFPMR